MRVCDICRKQLGKDDNWWILNFASNLSKERSHYYELCADHKNQILAFTKFKIEEAGK